MLVSGVCGTCEWDLHGMRMLGWLLDGDVVRLMVIIVDGGVVCGCCVGVWLERCRDGSYAINALCCGVHVGSLCMPSGVHCHLFRWFLGKCALVEVHPYMVSLALFGKCVFVTFLFWGIF